MSVNLPDIEKNTSISKHNLDTFICEQSCEHVISSKETPNMELYDLVWFLKFFWKYLKHCLTLVVCQSHANNVCKNNLR